MPPRIHAGRLATVAALLASSSAMAIEEPSFRVLERDGAFELREYAPYVVAETRVEAKFTDAGNAAFQRLFRYISGSNVAQQKIAMTAPVTQSRSEAGGEKIAMTAPVTQVAAGDAYRVAFTLPASYTLETAPNAARQDDRDPRCARAARRQLALLGPLDREQLPRARSRTARRDRSAQP